MCLLFVLLQLVQYSSALGVPERRCLAVPCAAQAKYGKDLVAGSDASNAALVKLLVDGHLPRQAGTPLVRDWECLRVSAAPSRLFLPEPGCAGGQGCAPAGLGWAG